MRTMDDPKSGDRGAAGWRTLWLTTAALVCFAGNSLLCRYALGSGAVDAASFTTLRIVTGALALLVLLRVLSGSSARPHSGGKWLSALYLFAYAGCFSYAYLELSAATGALLLFAAVQVTMIAGGVVAGERPSPSQWIGLLVALSGLAYLLSPGLAAPPVGGAVLMSLAGTAWGLYSLRGRGSLAPLAATTHNFLAAAPMCLLWSTLTLSGARISAGGLGLAVASGAVASGMGYVLWFGALGGLTATSAATVQLAVPVLTAAGGILLLSESLSLRLILSSLVILGGIGLAVTRKPRRSFS